YWRRYFKERANEYAEVWRGDRFILFQRAQFPGSYILKGEGELILQGSDNIKIKLNSTGAVLRFNYFPFLESSDCKLQPFRVTEQIDFIEVTECPVNKEIEIRASPVWKRVLGSQ
ncbi:MAG: hypothetical protein KDD42_02890, partial [Bdellovibrionales bacterium]|nr:hypothetical protein [Bdellovibrionales bacterium]